LIPAANITAWRRHAPWPEDSQVEQDLILSRLMVEIANDDLLGGELAMRGGTCLHKLHLPSPLRYSEDLDYVRRTRSGIKDHLQALRDVADRIGLEEHGTEQKGQMVHARFDTAPTSGPGVIGVKIEINIAEIDSCFPRAGVPLSVDSPWWRGSATIPTFSIEELMGTKLRALYQRSKGRDLFDLWQALSTCELDDASIVMAFQHYMRDDAFSFPELALNLSGKLERRDFLDDLSRLVTKLPSAYDPVIAANMVMERLGPGLRNAPERSEIDGGAWRR
jgi:predicted nucleotidyltransferase component of viral defense system